MKKHIRILLIPALFSMLALLLAVSGPVWAETAENDGDDRFAGKSWEQVMEEFFQAHYISNPNRVAVAYYNTVTGEEHLINGDQYFYAASVYKLPLNMYFAERVYLGEMDPERTFAGVPYSQVQALSLEYSNNPLSQALRSSLGTYAEYRAAVTPYVCPPGEEIDPAHIYGNEYTAAQVLYALKLLYADPDRYPDVLEHMKNVPEPSFFSGKEDRYVVAHKSGVYLDEDADIAALNDSGIVYTDEPILLVMLTNYLPGGTYTLADFCVLMCDYSQYWHQIHAAEAEAAARAAREEAERLAAEAEAAAREAAEAEAAAERAARAEAARLERERTEAETAAREAAEAEARAAENAESAARRSTVTAAAVIGLGGLFAAIWLRRRNRPG